MALSAVATIGMAINWHLMGRLARACVPPAAYLTVCNLPAGIVLVLCGLWEPAPSSTQWLVVAEVGVVYVTHNALRMVGLRRVPAARATLVAPLSAVSATLVAIVTLGQVPAALKLVGCVALVGAAVLAGRAQASQRASAARSVIRKSFHTDRRCRRETYIGT